MPTLFVGNSQPAPAGGDPEDLFKVTQLVKGDEAALPVDQTGCKMVWPSLIACRAPGARSACPGTFLALGLIRASLQVGPTLAMDGLTRCR